MFSDMMVLVVEDDARSLLSITRLLKGLGLRYKRNTTGAHVVEQVTATRPSVILLNVDLPEGDPYDICDRIRQNPMIADIPIVAIADNMQQISGCNNCGDETCFFALVQKPIEQNRLVGILECLAQNPAS